jgi:hypothetical protein
MGKMLPLVGQLHGRTGDMIVDKGGHAYAAHVGSPRGRPDWNAMFGVLANFYEQSDNTFKGVAIDCNGYEGQRGILAGVGKTLQAQALVDWGAPVPHVTWRYFSDGLLGRGVRGIYFAPIWSQWIVYTSYTYPRINLINQRPSWATGNRYCSYMLCDRDKTCFGLRMSGAAAAINGVRTLLLPNTGIGGVLAYNETRRTSHTLGFSKLFSISSCYAWDINLEMWRVYAAGSCQSFV